MSVAPYPWQAEAWRTARETWKRGAHALLLAGQKGLGKRDFAVALAQSILCEAPSDRDDRACEGCTGCHWLRAGTHPDYVLVEAPSAADTDGAQGQVGAIRERQIGIDQIRQLTESLAFTTHRGRGKVVVVHPAEQLNAAAANALLKSLEEPPAGTLFVLVTNRRALVIPTVRSRCQCVSLRPGERQAMQQWLRDTGIEDAGLYLALSGQSPLEAAAIAADDHWRQRGSFLNQLGAAGTDPVAMAERFRDLPPPLVLSWLQKWTFDLMYHSVSGRGRYHVDYEPSISVVAHGVSPLAIAKLHGRLVAAQRVVNHPVNARLFLEQLLIDYFNVCAPER
jgi:DNA polymerase III subunit delta'